MTEEEKAFDEEEVKGVEEAFSKKEDVEFVNRNNLHFLFFSKERKENEKEIERSGPTLWEKSQNNVKIKNNFYVFKI